MALTDGTKLGPYEIVAPLGAGGMGEVYRARDTRLERTVAIKILPEHLNDAQARQRFEREAKAISSLNHPHICTLYDVGSQDGTEYLVMECLEGETLADRLQKGALPAGQSLKIGIEVCEALDKAHRQGIVHRDLKPGNIMLTKSGVKLLDFGLAKAIDSASASGLTLSLTSPPPNKPVTAAGTVIGTFQYMAPEQIEGKEADARSDIFALGAVLYEMATGKRAFDGKSQASIVAAILTSEPQPISMVQPMSPPALDRVVKICLAKDPDERWQTAHDVKLQLQWIAEGGSQAGVPSPVISHRKHRERLAWILAASFLLLLILGSVAWWQQRDRHRNPMHFHTLVPFAANDVALSPDGKMLVMVAYSNERNNYALWMSEVGGRQTSSLPGTQGATYPFWSPDGKFIGFFADGKLKKVDALGGKPRVLCDAPNGRGGAWNRDGVIVFSPDVNAGLFQVSSKGGSPLEMTKLDRARFETTHRWPVFLPDGKHFLYLAANFRGHFENNAIFLGSLDSQDRRLLVSASSNAAYAKPGYLLYLRDKTLVAQPFDLRRYTLSGEPYPVSDEVLYFPTVDRAVFSVSGGEVLVTQTGKGASFSQLTWFDRSGKFGGTIGSPQLYDNVHLSPDGLRIVVDQTRADGRKTDIWVYEPARGTSRRLTFDTAADQTPIWSPDGRQILFFSNRDIDFKLYLKNSDGSGAEKQVATPGGAPLTAWDWSRDGKYILFGNGNELWSISLPDRVTKPLSQAKWTVRNAQISPDGRWMAYASNETGSMEIYVSPFPDGSGKWQVSTGGGEEPRWRHDGKELFYLSPEGKMMAVALKAGTSFEAGSPIGLFQTRRRQAISSQDVFSYDVSADGQKFLIATKVDEAHAAPLSITLNWASGLDK